MAAALTVLLVIASACSDRDRAATSPQSPTPRPESAADKAPSPGVTMPAAEAPTPADIARENAVDRAREPNDIDWSGGDPVQGQELYVTHCSICHGAAGRGDGPATPALNPKPRDFTDGTFYIDANANNVTGEPVDLARVILHGPAAFGGSPSMQGWRDAFSDDEIRDLIAYIQSLAAGSAGG